MPGVMISCGEASGDLYAGALAHELRRLDPGLRLFGMGGERLQAAGADLVADYRGISVTGLLEVVRLLPRTYALYRRLVAEARARRPEVAVLVDFPDFNFRLGRALRALGVPVVYYVAPQLWAWRPGRLRAMREFVDRVLVIFPFERALYEQAGVPVEFVGHPLTDLARAGSTRAAFLGELGLDAEAPTFALLPGSRANEVGAILPGLAAAAGRIAQALPAAQFVLARASGLDDRLFAPLDEACREAGLRLGRTEGRTDEVLASADVALTASGTATVQAALHECPMVIVYRLSPLTYRLGIRFVKVDTYGMVNLVAGRRIVPELIQDGFTPEAVAREALRFVREPAYADATRRALREVAQRLGEAGGSARAARAVLRVARGEATPHGARVG